jgi:hypothetical protein
MDDCSPPHRSILWSVRMRWTWTAIGALVALAGAAPAAAMPADGGSAKPKIVAAWPVPGEDRAVSVVVKGRDRDDVVRGVEIAWGRDQPEQGLSSCERTRRGADERRRGRLARFELAYTYPAAGDYTVTVHVLSGGCGKRVQQRSAPHTLGVHVD